MPGWTNRGKWLIMNYYFRRQGTLPTNFYFVLCTSANTPTVDTNTLGQLTEIAAGNGYTAGGLQAPAGTTFWDIVNQDDANNWATIGKNNMQWIAQGGPLPASGPGARWMVLTDDDATPANRNVYAFWDLGADRQVTIAQAFWITAFGLRITE